MGIADAGKDHGLVAMNQSLIVRFFIFFFFTRQIYKKIRDQPKLISILYYLGLF